MTMSQINIEKEGKKSAEDAKAATDNAAQQNKNNKETTKDPKITIPEDESRPKKEKKEDVQGDCHGCRAFLCTLLVLTFIGGGFMVYQHINFFCSGLMDLEGNDMCQQKDASYRQRYEDLQKSYKDLVSQYVSLNKQYDLLTRQNTACMRNFITSMSSMKQEYGEDQVDSILNQLGSAIHNADVSLE